MHCHEYLRSEVLVQLYIDMARLYQAKYSSVKVYYLAVIFLFAACSIAVAIDCNPDPTDMCKCRSSTGNIALDLRTFLLLP